MFVFWITILYQIHFCKCFVLFMACFLILLPMSFIFFPHCYSFIRISNMGIRDFEIILLDYFSKLPSNSKYLKKYRFSNGIWSSQHITECNNINKTYSLTYESIQFPTKLVKILFSVRKRKLKQACFPMY